MNVWGLFLQNLTAAVRGLRAVVLLSDMIACLDSESAAWVKPAPLWTLMGHSEQDWDVDKRLLLQYILNFFMMNPFLFQIVIAH